MRSPLTSNAAACRSWSRSRGERLLITKGAPEGVLPLCTAYEVDGQPRPLDAEVTPEVRRRPTRI